MATRLTSGKSRPSRSRFMPTSTSNSPRRRSRIISMRSMAPMSWCMYRHLMPASREVGAQILRHLLGERGDERALVLRYSGLDLVKQVVYLPLHRADGYSGVEQTGRADDLLDYLPGARALVLAGRGGDVTPPGLCAAGTPQTSAGGCQRRWADGSRTPPETPSSPGRRGTWRAPAAA